MPFSGGFTVARSMKMSCLQSCAPGQKVPALQDKVPGWPMDPAGLPANLGISDHPHFSASQHVRGSVSLGQLCVWGSVPHTYGANCSWCPSGAHCSEHIGRAYYLLFIYFTQTKSFIKHMKHLHLHPLHVVPEILVTF